MSCIHLDTNKLKRLRFLKLKSKIKPLFVIHVRHFMHVLFSIVDMLNTLINIIYRLVN